MLGHACGNARPNGGDESGEPLRAQQGACGRIHRSTRGTLPSTLIAPITSCTSLLLPFDGRAFALGLLARGRFLLGIPKVIQPLLAQRLQLTTVTEHEKDDFSPPFLATPPRLV